MLRQITRGPSEGSKSSELPPRAADFDVIEGGSTWKAGAYDRSATLPNSVVDTFLRFKTEERSWGSFLKVVVINICLGIEMLIQAKVEKGLRLLTWRLWGLPRQARPYVRQIGYFLGLSETDLMERGDTNAYKLAFWMLTYILFEKDLSAITRTETTPAVRGNDIDMGYLTNNCRRLRGVHYERMRITKCDIAIRKVACDIPMNGKILRAGNSVNVPICQLHDNESAFGRDHHTFDSQRFLKAPDLASIPNHKPFGGGRTYCPGRYFATPEKFCIRCSAFAPVGH